MKRLARVTSLLLCCGLAIPAVGEAKVQPSPTQVALVGGDSQSIRGTVSSRYVQCARERTVRVTDLSTGALLHTITTDRKGAFTIAVGDIPADSNGFRVTAQAVRIQNWQCQAGSVDVQADFVTLSGGPHGGAFTGVLFSSVPACEPGRIISLYEISSEPTFNGWDVADASGAWAIAQATGTWEARADPIFVRADGAFVFCRAVASFPWTFEEPPEE